MNITILVTGEIGVGKSTLINALIGVWPVQTGESIFSVTRNVDIIRVTRKGINMNIIDTDLVGDRDDEDMVQKIIQESGQIDLLLFCLKINDRLDRFHLRDMKILRDVFGEDVWKKAVFVLTFANEYNEPGKENKFIAKLNEWERELKKKMKGIIDPEIAEKIPIVPTGHKEPQLPDRESWISEFWIQGFRRMGFKAMVGLYIISEERLHSNTTEMHTAPERQPLISCHMTKVKVEKKSGMSENEVIFVRFLVTTIVSVAEKAVLGSTLVGPFLSEWASNYFKSTRVEEEEIVTCHEDAIIGSLILAFNEEYPEFVIFQKLKDKLLHFNNKDKTVRKEEL